MRLYIVLKEYKSSKRDSRAHSKTLKKGHAVANMISPTEAGTSNASSSTADSLLSTICPSATHHESS